MEQPNKHTKQVFLSARRAARVMAVQALYQFNHSGQNDPKEIMQEFLDYRCNLNDLPVRSVDWDFFSYLFGNVTANYVEIIESVKTCLNEKWSIERLDSVLKVILCVGIAEINHFNEIPVRSSLNEYVEVAKLFFNKQEVSFINGILNVAARRSRTSELLDVDQNKS